MKISKIVLEIICDAARSSEIDFAEGAVWVFPYYLGYFHNCSMETAVIDFRRSKEA